MWCTWRKAIGKDEFLDQGKGEMGIVDDLAAYMAYCASEKKNKEATVGAKLVAVNFYHLQYKRMKLPLDSPYIKGIREGIRRSQAEAGLEQRVRRPLTWGMITEMQPEFKGEGERGRVLWIGLALSYLLMLRSEELFDRGKGKVHEVHCLQRRDVAFFKGNEQLMGDKRKEADKVEVRFRGSKGDQEQKGAVLVRIKGGSGMERDEGAVALLVELFEHVRRRRSVE